MKEEFEDTKGVITQNPYIDEEQTTQWPKEKVQKDKQRSTKHTYKTKDRVTRTSLKTPLKTLLKITINTNTVHLLLIEYRLYIECHYRKTLYHPHI